MTRAQVRKLWIRINGNIPKGYNLHHINPIHNGGKNELNNLQLLSEASHAEAHRQLYLKEHRLEDLLAYLCLRGDIKEANYVKASLGGRASQKTLREKQLSSFYNPELRMECNIKARQKQMDDKTNQFIHCSKEKQAERGRKGGPANKGFRWVNDGKIQFKYTKKMQDIKSIEDFLNENKNIKIGLGCGTQKPTLKREKSLNKYTEYLYEN